MSNSNNHKVLFINNDGNGDAEYLEVPKGTTLGQFLSKHFVGGSEDALIRVNRQPIRTDLENAGEDRVLEDGDRVTATPTKVEGA